MQTIKLTTAQALLRFLANQYIKLDGIEYRFVQGIFGIFGHGNVTGIGEALEYDTSGLTYYQGHNEQGMAHAATAYAKQKNRLGIFACTSSIGPGATNMITAAATATTNRIPLLLLPGDIFSCRQPDPVLQQLEVSHDYTISVNDCFKPVSKYWDRIQRPEQLISACMNALRVLTDPAETGAVTLCLPQDVQSESYDYPEPFFAKRVWRIERESVSQEAIDEAARLLLNAQKPLIIAGGGVHYSLAADTLAEFVSQHQIPVAETQAGKSALPASHPMNVGGIGVTGSEAANLLAAQADLILVVGSRLQDFTTASKWGFKNETCQLINLNISRFDAVKMDSMILKGDAKRGLLQLSQSMKNFETSPGYRQHIQRYRKAWQDELTRVIAIPEKRANGLSQTAILGLLNQLTTKNDVIIGAAGSLPGDLHRLWQSKTAKDYHLEYAYSCMGYEISAGLGVRMAKEKEEGEVYVLVGDGSYIMLHSELLTCIQEKLKITVILFDNHGYQCIRNLQEANGSMGFGNEFRYRSLQSKQLDGDYIKIDFCRYAEALGAQSIYVDSYDDFKTALVNAKQNTGSSVIVLPVLPKTMSKGYETWWRVGVAAVSNSKKVRAAHANMQQQIESAKLF
ncbi:myo-inositol catabolism protein IolD [Legionella quinlivanii]|uniref:Myo-inositol catabolism protein IolD n=1 Tax=Legionella quinlivanii TaxID=45073 RepID=A0A0W0XZW7_9GAMM|nr:3D-(3,5/4)-trihydroxycyclohexane-1,2-dione acylhydrolase (decyclizing) [Legionella quinlivanii]KTD49942.1 myo-inositol catabolism protein IolD [Legionella quinlivanii]SEF97167.1 3D-(3,5/4)-trihydroxycyclohexane-1,2-dione hydrolase [Legionella quinlivanii DSM 21216]STY11282.1 myo-inositol catabolism protein IolD [Legionella quinlivanii]